MAEKKKNSALVLIIIILLILTIDIVGGYFIGTKLLIPNVYDTEDLLVLSEKSEKSEDSQAKSAPGFIRELEAINLNPANSLGEIFSCQLTLEAETPEVITELTTRDHQVKDIILNYLSFKTAQELTDVTKRAEYVKDLVKKINSVLTTGKVTDLYIDQWILQSL